MPPCIRVFNLFLALISLILNNYHKLHIVYEASGTMESHAPRRCSEAAGVLLLTLTRVDLPYLNLECLRDIEAPYLGATTKSRSRDSWETETNRGTTKIWLK